MQESIFLSLKTPLQRNLVWPEIIYPCIYLLCTTVCKKQVMINTSKEKHSLARKLWDTGIGGKGGVKRRGTRFGEKGNETKILYLALLLVLLHLHVLKTGFLSHYPFLQTLFPSFLHHLCLQFLYPTNFLVRECFSHCTERGRILSRRLVG